MVWSSNDVAFLYLTEKFCSNAEPDIMIPVSSTCYRFDCHVIKLLKPAYVIILVNFFSDKLHGQMDVFML